MGLRRDKVTGEWERLHTKELYDLYTSPNIVQVIKSRRMRLAGHIACTGERRSVYRILVERPGERQICIKDGQIKIILDYNKTCDYIWQ